MAKCKAVAGSALKGLSFRVDIHKDTHRQMNRQTKNIMCFAGLLARGVIIHQTHYNVQL